MINFFRKNSYTVHLFAVIHSLVAILSRALDVFDDLPLTLVTVLMIIIISIRNKVHIEVIATLSVVACFIGFLLGVFGASYINTLINNSTLSSAITTFIITEIIGWSTILIEKRYTTSVSLTTNWTPSIGKIIAIAFSVITLRLFYTFIFNSLYITQAGIYSEFNNLFSNAFAQIFLLCGNLTFISYNFKLRKRISRDLTLFLSLTFLIIISIIITLIVYYEIPYGNISSIKFRAASIIRLYSVIFFSEIIVFAIIYLINHSVKSSLELKTERVKKLQMQYQYNRLKQQINPHFLFNSLNILDYLVQENHKERASLFIRKLSSIYRYMLKNEGERLVTLKEELVFANMYIELLQERFLDGLNVKIEVDEKYLNKYIVPCSVQLLLENAIKHNIVSTDKPLLVDVRVIENSLVVRNNLQPRLSEHTSTHIGLNNIIDQYINLSEREPKIERDNDFFYVNLPIL